MPSDQYDRVIGRRFGGRAVIAGITAVRQVLLTLDEPARWLTEPGMMLGVVFRSTITNFNVAGGVFQPVGEVRWQSGGGGGVIEMDIVAGAACIAVPAASALEVRAYTEGTALHTVRIDAAVCSVRAPFARPAIRTTRDVLPMAAGRAVPQCAQSVSAVSNLPGSFGTVNTTFWADNPAVGTVTGRRTTGAGPFVVPGGSNEYQLVDAMGVVQTITSTWELAL